MLLEKTAKYGKVSFVFLINYCILTGILATCLSSLQFSNNPNLITSILYGLAGPFVIRDNIMTSLSSNIKNAVVAAAKKREEDSFLIKEEACNDIEKELANIYEEKTMIKK